MPFRRHSQLPHDLVRRLSAVSAELAACLDSVVAELHNVHGETDPDLVRCAQGLATTQIAITQQILLLTRLIENDGEVTLLEPQLTLPSGSIEQISTEGDLNVQSETPIRLLEAPALFRQAVAQTPIPSGAFQDLPNPRVTYKDHSLSRAAVIYASPEKSVRGSTTSFAHKLAKRVPQHMRLRYAVAILLVMGLWAVMRSQDTIVTPEQEQVIASEPESQEPTKEVAREMSITPDVDRTLTHEDVLDKPLPGQDQKPTIVVPPPPQETSNDATLVPATPDSAPTKDVGIDFDQPTPEPEAPIATPNSAATTKEASASDATPVPSTALIVTAKQTTPPDAKAALKEAQPPPKATTDAKPSTFKTIVKSEPAPVQKFAPAILALRDGKAALQIYQDLQKRHPAALGNRSAELRSFTGSDQTPWVQLLAVPSSSKEEAESVCLRLGPEGKALGCKVVPY